MKWETISVGVRHPFRVGSNLWSAFGELVTQEFSLASGHLTALLGGCLFAPSILTFWFVNGLIDFSAAIAIGSVQSTAGLQIRLLAYLLLVPTFLLVVAAATGEVVVAP